MEMKNYPETIFGAQDALCVSLRPN